MARSVLRFALAAAALAAPLLVASSAGHQRAGGGPALDGEALLKARLMEDIMWGRAAVGGSFSLLDHAGQRRALEDFRGKVVVLYFGYTFCPDVCPTDLVAVARMIDSLGPAGEQVQPLFVTLDPERDTAEQLALYVAHFHPRLLGLRGTEEEVARVAGLYKIYSRKVPARGSPHYLLDHSAYIYLLDGRGRYVGTFPPGTPPERMAEVVRELLEEIATSRS
ncbi:MAG TPA: SCO family protein [Burkholderiales bacterium]|nr:SCO family protein [Burkholderiales bacterium]